MGIRAVFSLIFMDIDNFKRVVDGEGHLNGSRTTAGSGEKIRGCLVEDAFAVAYGGMSSWWCCRIPITFRLLKLHARFEIP